MDIIEYRKTFAKNLKRMLAEKGMSQRELARRIDVSAGNITDWMNLKSAPRINVLDKICAIFNCERADLVEDYRTESIKVTQEEKNLIELYRTVPAEQRKIVFGMIRGTLNL